MQLQGTVAVVTGGNGGLGRRICHALAKEGCDIALVYMQSHESANAFAGELQATGVRAEAIACDVADGPQVERMIATVLERFGRLDILVNDAAYNKWIPFNDLAALTLAEWDKILSVNLTGPMLCSKAAAETMQRAGAGRIVNIASIAGLAPSGSSIPYAVSKAGLIHLTRCMAVGLAPDILVNCVAPGHLEGTRATANLAAEYRERATQSSLLKRAADREDVAQQVVGLCKTDSITGQTIVVDAGRVFH